MRLKIRAITFGIELGCGQAAGNLFASLHGISIERLLKSRCPAGVYVSMHFRDVPDMVTELHGQVPEKPGVLELPDTGRETGPGRADIIHMDLQTIPRDRDQGQRSGAHHDR